MLAKALPHPFLAVRSGARVERPGASERSASARLLVIELAHPFARV